MGRETRSDVGKSVDGHRRGLSRICLSTAVGCLALAWAFPFANAAEVVDLIFVDTEPQYFNLSLAEAIESLGAWSTNSVVKFNCSGTVVGPANPELCVEELVTTLSSKRGNATFVLQRNELDELRAISSDNPEQYVYGLPTNKYALPNVLYEASSFTAKYLMDGNMSEKSFESFGNVIFNGFNASAASLRGYYGVPDDVRGSDSVVQATASSVGVSSTAVNETAVDEYLTLQGLVPNEPLRFPAWGPPNNVSSCLNEDDCSEVLLDVETQQAFAPLARTYFLPTEVYNPLMKTAESLAAAGYSNVTAIIEQAGPNVGFSALDDLDPQTRQLVEDTLQDTWVEYFREFFRNLTESDPVPQVVSISWNIDYENLTLVPLSVFEDGLRNLTLNEGITILVASGDAGASAPQSSPCFPASDPLVANHVSNSWPQVSPWVTTVGGTQFLATEESPQEEVVLSYETYGGVTSAGGFAGPVYPRDLFSMPAWQEKAVSRYLAENNGTSFPGFPTNTTPGFNPSGRAYPDIAMYGSGWPLLTSEGTVWRQVGTSLAAPMAAAMFSMANQKLLEDGYEVIGYANPMLYWMGENCSEAFNDITLGNNMAGDLTANNCLFGFPAARGWDAATGFGSIRFEPFLACAKRYQDEVRGKGLEILPDGTYREAAGVPSTSPPSDSVSATIPVSWLALVAQVVLVSLLHF